MKGRNFLNLALELLRGGTETHYRAAAGRAYYALILECRDALLRWGISVAPHGAVHADVRLKLVYASDTDLKNIGYCLERLVRLRNRADYEMAFVREFASKVSAQNAVNEATVFLDLLDQIDHDPPRRTAAIAAIKP